MIYCLLQQVTPQLPSEVRAAYTLSSTKILGSWATGIATAWNQQDRHGVAEAAMKIKELTAALTSDPDIEVQERVRCYLCALLSTNSSSLL